MEERHGLEFPFDFPPQDLIKKVENYRTTYSLNSTPKGETECREGEERRNINLLFPKFFVNESENSSDIQQTHEYIFTMSQHFFLHFMKLNFYRSIGSLSKISSNFFAVLKKCTYFEHT